jgi:hypothetical protein
MVRNSSSIEMGGRIPGMNLRSRRVKPLELPKVAAMAALKTLRSPKATTLVPESHASRLDPLIAPSSLKTANTVPFVRRPNTRSKKNIVNDVRLPSTLKKPSLSSRRTKKSIPKNYRSLAEDKSVDSPSFESNRNNQNNPPQVKLTSSPPDTDQIVGRVPSGSRRSSRLPQPNRKFSTSHFSLVSVAAEKFVGRNFPIQSIVRVPHR